MTRFEITRGLLRVAGLNRVDLKQALAELDAAETPPATDPDAVGSVIEALDKDASEEYECNLCGSLYSCDYGNVPSKLCHGCAQKAVEIMYAAIAQLRAERDAAKAEVERLNGLVIDALAKGATAGKNDAIEEVAAVLPFLNDEPLDAEDCGGNVGTAISAAASNGFNDGWNAAVKTFRDHFKVSGNLPVDEIEF